MSSYIEYWLKVPRYDLEIPKKNTFSGGSKVKMHVVLVWPMPPLCLLGGNTGMKFAQNCNVGEFVCALFQLFE